jgi:hydrogenase nickel incorporation protein HypA/HybF
MHEWALAESVITAALDTAKTERLKKISEITIDMGELQQIERDIFRFALKELTSSHSPLFKNVRFHLRTEKSTLKCTVCGHEWTYADMKKNLEKKETEAIHFIPEVVFVHARCPRCGSPDFEITKGRGVTVRSIKGTR